MNIMHGVVKLLARKFLVLGAMGMSSVCADIIVYNQENPPSNTGLPSGGWGTYRGFSVNFSDAALSTDYTPPDAAPTPSELFLFELTLRHAGNQGATPTAPTGDWTQVMLKVYTTQTPTIGSYVGDSSNIVNMSYGGVERNETFLFNNVQVDAGTKYYFYFSNTPGNVEPNDQTWSSGRLRVSNVASHTFTTGNLVNPSWGNQDTAFDAVFAAEFRAVPEPSSLLLLGAGGVLILRCRTLARHS